MMQVRALGVGGAFTDRFYQTNYLVELSGFRLLIDLGSTLRYSLAAAGYTAKDIDAVALTHFHSDHVGGLEEFSQRCRYLYQYQPSIYVMPDQMSLLSNLFALHGTNPEDYLKVKVVTEGNSIIIKAIEGIQYRLDYYSTLGLHAEVTSNYIVCIRRIDQENKTTRIVITGDIGAIEKSELEQLVADPETVAVLHDCSTAALPVSSHPNLEQMKRFYPSEQRCKIYVIHYGDNIDNWIDRIEDAGFQVAIQGAVIEF